MDARRPSELMLQVRTATSTVPPQLRTVGSADYLQIPNEDETVISAADLTFSSHSSPTERKKRFRFPKLVLQDKKKKQEETQLKSCIEISPQIPNNDTEIHANELQCCPPCETEDGKTSKYIVERSDWGPLLRAQPGDLACFLASCPPGLAACEKHHRRRTYISPRETVRNQRIGEDFRGVAEALVRDASRLSFAVQSARLKAIPSRQVANDGSTTNPVSPSLAEFTGTNSEPSEYTSRFSTRKKSSALVKSPVSDGSSVTSGSDAFPHAARFMESGSNTMEPLSTSIMTNFSLGGRKSKFKLMSARQALQKRRSESRSQGFAETLHSDLLVPSRQDMQRLSEPEAPFTIGRAVTYDRAMKWDDTIAEEPSASAESGTLRDVKAKMRLMMPGSPSTQARTSLTSYGAGTDDTAPTDISENIFGSKKWIKDIPDKKFEPCTEVSAIQSGSSSRPKSKTSLPMSSSSSKIATGAKDAGVPLPPVLSPIPTIPESISANDWTFAEVLRSFNERSIKSNQDGGDTSTSKDSDPSVSPKAHASAGPTSDVVSKTESMKRGESTQPKGASLRSSSPKTPFMQSSAIATHNLSECNVTCETKSPPPMPMPLPKNSPAPAVESKMSPASQPVDYPLTKAAEESLNAAYWGFVPALRVAVKDVVQGAVRSAVNGSALSVGGQQTFVQRAKVEPPPATIATNNGDSLRRTSVGEEAPPSTRGSESTIIRTSPVFDTDQWKSYAESMTKICTGGKAPACEISALQSSPRSSVASKGQENDISQAMKSPTGSRSGQRGAGAGNLDVRDITSTEPAYCEDLETVPLDDMKGGSLANQGLKILTAWNKGAGPGYAPIPDRRSSRNEINSPKKTPSSSFKVSPKTSVAAQRSMERLAAKSSRRLRPITSKSSLKKEVDPDTLSPLIDKGNEDSSTPPGTDNKFGRQNTMVWLKELLSSNGPYEPRFTTLPPRTRRDQNSSTGQEKPVGEAYLDPSLRPAPLLPIIAPKTVASKRSNRAEASEQFTKTINDLEVLMNEALLIARQAADSQDPLYTSGALENAAKLLRKGRQAQSEEMLSRMYQSDQNSDVESLPSVHESLRDYSESESEMSEDYQYYAPRPPTPPKLPSRGVTLSGSVVLSRNPSGWPPTGRVYTPYPPTSLLPSNESPIVASGGKSSTDSIDKLTSADPQSRPTENDIDDPRPRISSMPPGLRSINSVLPQRPSQREAVSEHGEADLLSESGISEPLPEFVAPDFSKARAVTFLSKGSGKSPRRLSPIKSDPAGYDSKNDTSEQIRELPSPLPYLTPQNASPRKFAKGHSEEDHQAVGVKLASNGVPSKREVRDYIVENRRPPIHQRGSSLNLKQSAEQAQEHIVQERTESVGTGKTGQTYNWQDIDEDKVEPCSEIITKGPTMVPVELKYPPRPSQHSFDGSIQSELDFTSGFAVRQRGGGGYKENTKEGYDLRDDPDPNLPQTNRGGGSRRAQGFSLRGKTHVSLREHHLKGFSLTKVHKKQPIARDWSPGRKRFVASVACLSTALIGLLVGVYAGQTPSIQYYIVDFHHYTVLGNVFFFVGLSIPTFFFWPLPLLHGRKPYILGSLSLAMPLLFPQALAVGQVRSPYVATWRVALILPRATMGFVLGFANMNFKCLLTDVFGASLQSANPHQEHVDEFDVRRHGGGMGIWLGIWTWCALGSIGVGFMIGAIIINQLSPAVGFYITIAIIAFVMLLNVVVPETRRAAFRKSVAEVPNEKGEVSRRLARGEVKMHMVKSGPKWWGQEFHYGVMLSLKMLRQPGFCVMAVYVAWIYGQMVLTILVSLIPTHPVAMVFTDMIQLLGALMSRDYKLKSPQVAASATAIPLGALLAVPLSRASVLSRARQIIPFKTDVTSHHKKLHLSSHMVRRTIFILVLPFAGLGVTISASGPPVPFIIPIVFAGVVGFLSNLAMSECHGILMETFDTSDLTPGMTGRARGSSGDKLKAKRTNYSSFPRVQSAFAIIQGFGYLIGAVATGLGGVLTRHVGAQAALGTMAGVLLILSLMLLAILVRFTSVQIIPDNKKEEMDQYHQARRASQMRRNSGINDEEEPWRPLIIGNPHHHYRRMNLLELGAMSRYSEIRMKNKLVDENSLEARHPNRAAMQSFENRIKEKEQEIVINVRRSLSRHSSRGSRQSRQSYVQPEQGDLGGFREIGGGSLKRDRSGNGSRRGKGTSTARNKIDE